MCGLSWHLFASSLPVRPMDSFRNSCPCRPGDTPKLVFRLRRPQDQSMSGVCHAWPYIMTGMVLQVLATTEEKPGIVYAELDYAEIEKRRTNMPIMQQKRYDLYSLVDKTM